MKQAIVDLDGIVVDLMTDWLKRIAEETGIQATVADITNYTMDHNKVFRGVSAKLIYDILGEPGFFFNLKPLPGAIEGVRSLQAMGYNVIIATAHFNSQTVIEKELWLKRYFPDLVKSHSVFFGHQKWNVRGDLYVDDKPSTIEACLALPSKPDVLSLRYEYNKHLPGVVESWDHILNQVQTYAKIDQENQKRSEALEREGS